jgi:hypothetical protein
MENTNVDKKVSMFEFSIGYIPRQAPMKNIPLFTLSNFHGLARWFMGLGGDSITSWDNMKQLFMGKYTNTIVG